MRRMDKVFADKGIVFDPDWRMMMCGPEHDCCQRVVDITKDFIITVYYSAVLDPMFNLYDRRTFEFIGQQDVHPEYTFFGEKSSNPWMVAMAE